VALQPNSFNHERRRKDISQRRRRGRRERHASKTQRIKTLPFPDTPLNPLFIEGTIIPLIKGGHVGKRFTRCRVYNILITEIF